MNRSSGSILPNRSIQLTAGQPQFRTAEEEADVAGIDLRGNAQFRQVRADGSFFPYLSAWEPIPARRT
jgi:hypothetical protein